MSNENSTKLVGEASIWTVILWVAIVFGAMIFVSISGCRFLQCLGGNTINTQPQESPIYSPLESLKGIVKSSSWLLSASILGIGISVFALVNGSRWGFAGLAGCFASLAATITVSRYAAWMAILGMIGAILLALYTIFRKNKALKEIIKGTQLIRDNISGGIDKQTTSKMLDKTQSQSTKNIVKQVKETL